jgi:hypothetical protein
MKIEDSMHLLEIVSQTMVLNDTSGDAKHITVF